MSQEISDQQTADPQETIRLLHKELEESNSGLVALTLELEQRVDDRTAELRVAHNELRKTNSELMQLTLELEERVAQRTEEIRKLNQELEERVRERTADLEASNKDLEAFTYSVSHDLRAPLRHIDGFSKLLLEEDCAGLTEDSKRYLARIREGTKQMGLLVDDLLNLARVGRSELTRQVTGLSSLAREVAEEIKRENPERQIEWKIEPLPFIECDPGLMKQVFVNLLSNAAKYTRPRPQARIEIGVLKEKGQPVIFVRDNGVGFSMKYADKLFGVFQRLHRAEDFEGTGIGLATVQRILHKHGGHAWAHSELDKGATFYFTLGGGDGRIGTEEVNTAGVEQKAA